MFTCSHKLPLLTRSRLTAPPIQLFVDSVCFTNVLSALSACAQTRQTAALSQ